MIENERNNMELKWKSCFRAGVTIGIIFLLIHYWAAFTGLLGIALGAAMPLLLGCAVAYVVNILMSFYERHFLHYAKSSRTLQKLSRPVCILLALISIAFIAFFIIRMIVPELISCVQILLEELPKALQSAYQWLEDNFQISSYLQQGPNSLLQGTNLDWKEIVAKAAGILFTGVGGAMNVAVSILSSVFSVAVTVLVAVIFSIYLLAGKEKIGSQIMLLLNHYLPAKIKDGFLYVIQTINQSFHNFIVGQCMEAVILGLLCITGMLLLQLPYAAMVGCLIGFTALIPVAGAYIGAVVGAFMIFTVSPAKAIIFIIFLVILQQLEDNLVYPRVVGSSIGLPGIWVLAAVTVGGGVMGIGGMLLGVPLAASVYQLLKDHIKKDSKKDK